MMNISDIRTKAIHFHYKNNIKYDGNCYSVHLDMVANELIKYRDIFKSNDDFINTFKAVYFHDVIEDCFVNVSKEIVEKELRPILNKESINIVHAVTDSHGKNRYEKHKTTMKKTVKDYRAIILKLCDISANTIYSKKNDIRKFERYQREYIGYRRTVFFNALNNYIDYIDVSVLKKLNKDLDDLNNIK